MNVTKNRTGKGGSNRPPLQNIRTDPQSQQRQEFDELEPATEERAQSPTGQGKRGDNHSGKQHGGKSRPSQREQKNDAAKEEPEVQKHPGEQNRG